MGEDDKSLVEKFRHVNKNISTSEEFPFLKGDFVIDLDTRVILDQQKEHYEKQLKKIKEEKLKVERDLIEVMINFI
jgi:NDP-sugar pyrophosphorylase family protein